MGSAGARLRAVLGVRSSGPLGAWPTEAPDADALVREFHARFDAPPAGVWHAPGRLAVLGEHTEVSGGAGLYTALPWGATVAVGTLPGRDVRVATPGGPVRPRKAAARAVAEAVDTAHRTGLLGEDSGIRVVLDADLPGHSSLGFAGAVGAAVTLALADLGGGPPPEGATADQRASLAARPGCAVRVNLKTLRTTVLPFDLAEAGLRLMVVDTGALPRRDLRAARSAELERAQSVLGPLRAVQDLTAALGRLSDPVLRRRVEYAVTEVHRLNAAVGLLRAGRPGEIGPLLSASHLSLRRFGLPTSEVELAAETASRAGARGVRMSGWAGTVLVLAAEERVRGISAALAEEFGAANLVPPRVRVAVPSAGAHRLR